MLETYSALACVRRVQQNKDEKKMSPHDEGVEVVMQRTGVGYELELAGGAVACSRRRCKIVAASCHGGAREEMWPFC